MPELRKDYILDRWVIVSEKRDGRPQQFAKNKLKKDGFCYFCPGNEKTTTAEIGRIEEKGKWKLRWFSNMYPAVAPKGSAKLVKKDIYHHGSAYGYHEIIVETNDHKKQLGDLSVNNIKQTLEVYANRITELSKKKDIKYALVVKNQGGEGGTSIIHSHSQVVAYSRIPKLVQEEISSSIKQGKCEYCKIIKKEAKSKRLVKQNKNFIAFCPYAPRFNYEVWVFPKKHIKNITDFNEEQLNDLASMMKFILVKVGKLTDSYNFFLHYAPKGKDLHFHIEVCPRISIWAGFEFGSGETTNSIGPETAAKYYRAKNRN